MASNSDCTNHTSVDIPLVDKKKNNEISWNSLVEEEIDAGNLIGVTCRAYSTKDRNSHGETDKCRCGRLKRSHSFTESSEEQNSAASSHPKFIDKWNLTVYGQLINSAKFIRCYEGKEGTLKTLCQLIQKDVKKDPVLLISCFGGADYFNMTDKLETQFMKGISQAALTKGVWLLTTGLNSAVSKLIGQSVRRYRLLKEKSHEPILIGMTSWGTVTEHTRTSLKLRASMNRGFVEAMSRMREKEFLTLNYDDKKTLDKNHSHFLLLDNGKVNTFLDDRPRSEFVEHVCTEFQCQAITIIVEGGLNTLEVIGYDLQMKRPVIIIQGSGRLANVLGTLFETTSNGTILEDSHVEKQLELFFQKQWFERKKNEDGAKDDINCIKAFFNTESRQYLSVFNLESDISLTDIIFKAVDTAQTAKQEQDSSLSETTLTKRDDSPVERSKTQKEKYLKLAVSWNYADRTETMPKRLEDDPTLYPRFFEQALKENQPAFVDFFLRRSHDPLVTTRFLKDLNRTDSRVDELNLDPTTSGSNKNFEYSEICFDKKQVNHAISFLINWLYTSLETHFDHWNNPTTLKQLDKHYARVIGPFAQSFYFRRTSCEQLWLDVQLWMGIGSPREAHGIPSRSQVNDTSPEVIYTGDKPFGSQAMLRELFFWSVYAGYADIAFVLLLQMESRMTAALIAAGMAQHLSLYAITLDVRHKYSEQAEKYEEYATNCINICYNQNERRACQLLLRENLLFGNVTCMQVAVASGFRKFINTDCFDQVLSQQWFGHLPSAATESSIDRLNLFIGLITFGLKTSRFRKYCANETLYETLQMSADTEKGNHDRWTGIDDYIQENPTFLEKLHYFHSAPIVKICYDFVFYLWFLLVFSYMMLFQMNMDANAFHWTRIYVIITVSAMLIEEGRTLFVNYHTRMMEKWHRANLWRVFIYPMPYILFYIGIVFYFLSRDQPKLFTTARIILAIDLEIWFLFSLRFASGSKMLGPKLFMIQNMLRYLTAFMYIIFVCVAAYGVVSRSLTMYNQLEFTVNSVFTAVFYQPYWFLYSIAEQELATLDGIISNATSSAIVAEATITHILLAFHMILINILILNLLIAAFNFTINEVQEKNEYFWRYQRYQLIRDYFVKPLFAFPPLSLLAYIGWFINAKMLRGTTYRVFKLRCIPRQMDTRWTEFENAATYEHARKFVEDNYRTKPQDKMSILQSQVKEMKNSIDELQEQANRIMARVGMSSASLSTSEQPADSNT